VSMRPNAANSSLRRRHGSDVIGYKTSPLRMLRGGTVQGDTLVQGTIDLAGDFAAAGRARQAQSIPLAGLRRQPFTRCARHDSFWPVFRPAAAGGRSGCTTAKDSMLAVLVGDQVYTTSMESRPTMPVVSSAA